MWILGDILSGGGMYKSKTKFKMTRNEAKQKLEKVLETNRKNGYIKNKIAIDDWLDSLEALGLIEFDKEVKMKLTPYEAVDYCRRAFHDTNVLIAKLESDFGYKIIKA